MKKVLIIIEKFYPNKTAITNCLESIFDELILNNISIDVLTYRQSVNLSNFNKIDGINIYRVNDYYNISKNIFIKKIFWRLFRKLTLESDFVRKGRKLLYQNQYQVIIACSYPFLMEKMALKIAKKTNVSLISCQFDPYYNNKLLDSNSRELRLNDEIKTLSEFKKIFLPPDNYNENMFTPLKQLQKKYYPLDLALIKEWNKYDKIKNNCITFSYAGVFYDNIRNPFKMLDFFKKLNFDFEIYIYCIASDNIKNKINDYVKYFNGKLIVKYNQTKEECNKLLYNSNFCINIGNLVSNQTPSKLYELISLGKPIINFYELDNDSSVYMLSKYDLCLNVKNSGENINKSEFKQFVDLNKNKKYSFQEIEKKYKSAKEISKEFVKEVEKCCNEQN